MTTEDEGVTVAVASRMTGAERIAAERQRQLDVEGWDAKHDRGHAEELARAAAAYALPPNRRVFRYESGAWRIGLDLRLHIWPWLAKWWKPTPKDRVRELEKAGALIAAAIDSLQDSRP